MNWIKLPSGMVLNLDQVLSVHVGTKTEYHVDATGRKEPREVPARDIKLVSGQSLNLDEEDMQALAGHLTRIASR